MTKVGFESDEDFIVRFEGKHCRALLLGRMPKLFSFCRSEALPNGVKRCEVETIKKEFLL